MIENIVAANISRPMEKLGEVNHRIGVKGVKGTANALDTADIQHFSTFRFNFGINKNDGFQVRFLL